MAISDRKLNSKIEIAVQDDNKTKLADFGKVLMLIPAAGFGTRVGSPEAKEMLLDSQGRPLIEWGLELARKRNWSVHVILRQEKKSLINFLQVYSHENHFEVSQQLIEPTKDWPETLLKSEPFWQTKNLVWLPDTRFAPDEALDQMAVLLDKFKIVYSSFKVENSSTWGVLVPPDQIAEKCELVGSQLDLQKSTSQLNETRAWGLMGFDSNVGRRLLEAHLQSTLLRQPMQLPEEFGEIGLAEFIDLTRGGK